MTGECIARMEIEVVDPVSIVRSLEPDNEIVPDYLSVSCRPEEDKVVCIIVVRGCDDPKRILSLRNTIDEIMVLARSVDETLKAVGNSF